jgi:hypothetical protein
LALTSGTGLNAAGLYVVSLVVGAVALAQFVKLAERGVLRSGLRRSGILGAEPSTTVPLLERVDRLLTQRVSDLTVFNYSGIVGAVARADASATTATWMLFVWFEGKTPMPPGRPSLLRRPRLRDEEHLRAAEAEAALIARERDPQRSEAMLTELRVAGGEFHDTVPFTLSVSSALVDSAPVTMSASVPARGRSIDHGFVLTRRDESGPPLFVVLQVEQGGRAVQVLRVPLPS